jgi:hypothetical protein
MQILNILDCVFDPNMASGRGEVGRKLMSALRASRTDRVDRATISTSAVQRNRKSSLGQAASQTACFRQQAVHSWSADKPFQPSRGTISRPALQMSTTKFAWAKSAVASLKVKNTSPTAFLSL